jgi:hypothetical protein
MSVGATPMSERSVSEQPKTQSGPKPPRKRQIVAKSDAMAIPEAL